MGSIRRQPFRWLAALICLVGIVSTAVIAHALWLTELGRAQAEFRQRAREQAQAIEREMRIVVEHVDSLAYLYQTYGEINEREFTSFTTAILNDHPTIQALGFNPVVRHDQRAAHEAAMRAEGFADYRIRERGADGTPVVARPRERYVVAGMMAPLAGNEAAIGYDIASEPIRREALERAEARGETAMTAPIRLVQEAEGQYGALICHPVYRAEGAGELRGFAVGVIRYGTIVEHALDGLRRDDIVFALSEPEELGPSPFPPFVYRFEIGGRELVASGSAASSWTAGTLRWPLWIVVTGLLFTALVVGYVLRQSAVRRRLLALISQRELAEQRQAGFGRMLDESQNEIYLVDVASMRFLHANLGALKNLGYTMDELREMTPLDINPGLSPEAFRERSAPLRDGTSEKVTIQGRHRRRDGSCYDTEVHLQTTSFDGAPAYIAMVLDVTERKRMDARKSQSQRIEALGTLAGGIAHDFNNALTAILGNADLGKLETTEPETRERFDEIVRASERARDVARSILTFSRKGAIERRPVDLGAVISETLGLIRASLPTSIEIRTRLVDGAVVEGDAGQLYQVIMNLCTNAGQAMSGGGLLEIVLERDAGNSQLRLRVSDTGPGVPREIAERVFDPFFTTKRPDEGTGLGLAVTHGIVAAHGGSIRLLDRAAGGAIFEITLPELMVRPVPDPRPQATAAGGSERILLVDDEPSIVQLMKHALKRAGYSVESHADGSEALDAFLADPTGFDLVITDFAMPRMNGVDLARGLYESRAELPVILVSGFGAMIDNDALAGTHVVEVVAKPPRIAELLERVRRALDARESVRSSAPRAG